MEAVAIVAPDGTVTRSGLSDRVPWWSFTKTALSIATLRLAEVGLLGLDDRLPGEPFTTRQLLRHEAGLPDYGSVTSYHSDVANGVPPWTLDRLLAAVDAARLRYEPGAGWAYSNIGYLRVAQIIERVSGRRLSAALDDLVFDPAGLESPRLALSPGDLADVQMGGTSGYHPGWVFHGLIVGTVVDAARLLWLLASGRLLKPATLASMMQARPLPDYQRLGEPEPGYGLGLMLAAENPAAHPFGHDGEGPGSRIAVRARNRRAAAAWVSLPATVDLNARVHEMLS
nr:serine hydrolase domain-containing protein [uncultured Lichenicoccus sp.]